jgi:hypothetical protein
MSEIEDRDLRSWLDGLITEREYHQRRARQRAIAELRAGRVHDRIVNGFWNSIGSTT